MAQPTLALLRDAHLVPEQGVRALDCELEKIVAVRDAVFSGAGAGLDVLRAIVTFQREDGSFALVSDYRMDGDCRVAYVYRPSYACCQVLMASLLAGVEFDGMREALARGLAFCCTRGLNGHGYDAMRQQLEDLGDFATAGLPAFLEKHDDLCPEFTSMVGSILDSYEVRLLKAQTRGDWDRDFTLELLDVLAAYGRDAQVPVFVYGTLLQGMCNAPLLDGSAYLGVAVLEGYSLYDLGAYPGIKPAPGTPGIAAPGRVMGELRLVDAATLRRLHVLEGKGTLYDFERVVLAVNGQLTPAFAYVYRGEVERDSLIPLQLQPYRTLDALKKTHVWYVSYGSNILYERFMCYVAGGFCEANGRYYQGCSDPTPPADVVSLEIPYDVYFGNRSGTWGGAGVAFLDVSTPGSAYARAYLITKEQYEQIHCEESAAPGWYPHEVDLGSMSGIPMRTFTNRVRRDPNPPSEAYLEVLRQGFAEAFHPMSCGEIDEYLNELMER